MAGKWRALFATAGIGVNRPIGSRVLPSDTLPIRPQSGAYTRYSCPRHRVEFHAVAQSWGER